jgi:hypothetical protein
LANAPGAIGVCRSTYAWRSHLSRAATAARTTRSARKATVARDSTAAVVSATASTSVAGMALVISYSRYTRSPQRLNGER